MEALRIQVDQLKWENHQLKAENQKLRENNVEQAAQVDLEQELEMSKSKLTELEETCSKLNESMEASAEELKEANSEIYQLRGEQLQNEQRWDQERKSLELQLELKCYKAVEAERSKWEAQEAWWRKEIDSLRAELREVSYQRLNVTPLCPDHTVISQSNLQSSAGTIGLPGLGNPRATEKEVGFLPSMASTSWEPTIPSINNTSDSNSNTSCPNNVLSGHHSRETTTGSINLSYIWSPLESVAVSNLSGQKTQNNPIMATHVITTESSRLPQTMDVCMNRVPSLSTLAHATTLASSVGRSLITTAPLSTSVAQVPTIGNDTRITEGVTLHNHVTTSLSTGVVTAPMPTVSTVGSTTLLPAYTATQQLPPISKFSGDEKLDDNTTFPEWLEQFEMVANLAGWGDQAKLVNLTTRLKGSAYAFLRSCTPQQRGNYSAIVQELKKRFVPVQIEAIQSGLFHERRQNQGESVDEYAQDLRRLYQKAYSQAQKGSSAAQKMGESVLAYQFVSGLLPDLKVKVAGTDGGFEHQLLKARFEEAKIRELSTITNRQPMKAVQERTEPRGNYVNRMTRPQQTNAHGRGTEQPQQTNRYRRDSDRCHKCGMPGHFRRDCPYPQPHRATEARGNRNNPSVRQVTAVSNNAKNDNEEVSDNSTQQRVVSLREQLREAEKQVALEQTMATMHGIISESETNKRTGPILMSTVQVNSIQTEALIDTGSPTTIISLKLAMRILKQDREQYASLAEWKVAASDRLEPPTMTLKSYTGGELNLIGQLQVQLTTISHVVDTVVQVQKDAPVDLLLGTDVQPALGFSLIQCDGSGTASDLTKEGLKWSRLASRTDTLLDPKLDQGSKTNKEAKTKTSVTVKLLQASRIPSRHRKIIQAKVVGATSIPLSLFEPLDELTEASGVVLEAGTLEAPQGTCVTLMIENPGLTPISLKKDTVLGTVDPVELITNPSTEPAVEQDTPDVISRISHLTSFNGSSRQQELVDSLNLQTTKLSPEQLEELKEMIKKNSDVFAVDPSELGSTDLVTHHIDTGEHQPVRQLPRRMPYSLRSKATQLVQEMLEQGVITPSASPWASPIVLVRKKDGNIRFCVDYRRLNSITKLDVFPLPRIDDTLDLLAQNSLFSTLDLASGYWQVKMDSESREKTAFVTTSGLYEFVSMPFGLCNAPATFQRLMEIVLNGLARDVCMVYLDDILVMGKTFNEHLENLQKVFSRLKDAGLTLKPKKCHLMRRKVEYLGHIVSGEGVAPDPSKVAAVQNFLIPTDVKALRSFLGLAAYYRKFVPNFSKRAHPLFQLTRQDTQFQWSELCQNAFDSLKKLLTESPILAFPNFNREFLLETDASGNGLGAVLAQQQEDGQVRPIAYASRTLQGSEKNYGISEMEALAVVWATKHFRTYLYGHHCKVFTDHQALKALLNTPQPSGKLARWGMAIQELDLEILYRSGKKNANADSLSRYPTSTQKDDEHDGSFGILAMLTPVDESEGNHLISEQQRADPGLADLIAYLETGALPTDHDRAQEITLIRNEFALKDKVLYHLEKDGTLRLVPPISSRRQLFDEAHSGGFGGHLREAKTHSKLSCHYWWPHMRSEISKWSRACLTCATRQPGQAFKPPLTPIPVGGAFDRLGVDVYSFPDPRMAIDML